MTDYIGKKVLYATEYGESIETIASIDEDGRVYFEPNKNGLVNTAMLESLVAHDQIFPDPEAYGADWETRAAELRSAIGTHMTVSGGEVLELDENRPLEDDEFQSWHDDPGYY